MTKASAASNAFGFNGRSAEESVGILNNTFGPDDCDRLALIACLMDVAVFERHAVDALFWSVVLARSERRPLTAAMRRELQALLDDSQKWSA